MKYFKKLVIGCLALSPIGVFAQNPFGIEENDTSTTRDIYGYDSRREAKQYDYNGYTKAVMTSMNAADFSGDKVVGLTLEGALKNYFKVDDVHSTVRFKEQPAIGGCTGFLIAPNIMVTAGHCISGDPHKINNDKVLSHTPYSNKYGQFTYSSKKWVLDYTNDIKMTQKYHEKYGNYYVAQIPTSKQYKIKTVLTSVLDNKADLDYAVVLLDRETDRDPFRFRTGAKIAKGDGLAMIGTPSGLPLKLSDGAKVTINSATSWFGTNLDAFGGNSGGPVYNTAGLNMIEGILVRGRVDKGLKGFYVDSTCNCVKEVRYGNDEANSVFDDYNIPLQQISTEVQRITTIPLNIKVMAIYSNLEYAIRKNNTSRFDKWNIYKWAYNNDTASFLKDALPGKDPLGVVALKNGRTEMFKSMIDLGMKTELDLGEGKTMLYHAIDKSNLEAVKYILKQGYDLSMSDDQKNTPLHWAVKKGDINIVKEIIKNGADLNKKNSNGETVLHLAVGQWSFSLIQTLVQNGANAKITDSSGKTPSKKAKAIKFKDAAKYLKKAEKGKL